MKTLDAGLLVTSSLVATENGSLEDSGEFACENLRWVHVPRMNNNILITNRF